MQIVLQRQPTKDGATLGSMSVDGAFQCFTLELPIPEDGQKIAGQTCISAGIYEIKLTWSPRFNRIMPQIMDVPGFDGVRIHWGNWPRNTEGCILTGETEGDAFIGHSVDAWTALDTKLAAVDPSCEKITIDVRNP